jgi:hypothetical protein
MDDGARLATVGSGAAPTHNGASWELDGGRRPATPNTIRKHHSFVGVFQFVGTDEYIQIIFIGS